MWFSIWNPFFQKNWYYERRIDLTILLTENLVTAIYEQIVHESSNAAIYQYISASLKNKGLDRIAKRFDEQVVEERSHSKMLIDFLTDMGAEVKILAVPAVDLAIVKIEDVANAYLEREILTTESINSIKLMAMDENSPVCEEFIRGMIGLQQKEYEEAISFKDKATLLPEWWQVSLWNMSEA